MNNFTKNIVVLLIICSFFALVLGFVNYFTEPLIKANKLAKEQKAFKALITEGMIGQPLEIKENDLSVKAFYPVTLSGDLKSYLVNVAGFGYGGEMTLLAEISPEGKIIGAILTDNSETPGLGKKAESSEYMKMFLGTGLPDKPVPLTKGDLNTSDADAVSGASITFSGVAAALEKASRFTLAWEEKNGK